MPKKEIREVLKDHTDELMAVAGVVGVAEGKSEGKPCIRVFIADNRPKIQKQLPSCIEGYRLLIEKSGEFRALGT